MYCGPGAILAVALIDPPAVRSCRRPASSWCVRKLSRAQSELSVPGQGAADTADRLVPLLRPTRGPHPGASLRRGCEATSQLERRSSLASAKRALGAHVFYRGWICEKSDKERTTPNWGGGRAPFRNPP